MHLNIKMKPTQEAGPELIISESSQSKAVGEVIITAASYSTHRRKLPRIGHANLEGVDVPGPGPCLETTGFVEQHSSTKQMAMYYKYK